MPPDLVTLGRSRIYEATAPVQAIQADITGMRGFDKYHERKRRTWGTWAILCIVIGFILSFFLVGIPVLIAGIVFAFVWNSHRRADLTDERYELVDKLLSLLGRDMAREAPVEVRIDLATADQKAKLKGKGEVGIWKVEYYEDPWLRLKGRLLDGSHFVCTATEMRQNRSAWKRGSSGKYKRKSKTKSATRAEVRIKVKPEKYAELEAIREIAEGAVQLPEGALLKDFAFGDDALGIEVVAKQPLTASLRSHPNELSGPEMFAMMFMSLYQVLNLARGKKQP